MHRQSTKVHTGTSAGIRVGGAALGLALLLAVPMAAHAGDAGQGNDARPHYTFNKNDPLEPMNRTFSEMNRFFRRAFLDPLVTGYQAVTPKEMQASISNAVSNLTEPVTAVSSLLQGDANNAATATERFVVNSTVGLGGTRDPATGMGLKQRREDLGQAMGADGIAPGPHLVLPLLGPSNARDAVGDAVTALTSPLPLAASVGSDFVEYSDNRNTIESIDRNALDPYLAEKAAYEQHRRYEVQNGKGALPPGPSFVEDSPSLAPTKETASKQ